MEAPKFKFIAETLFNTCNSCRVKGLVCAGRPGFSGRNAMYFHRDGLTVFAMPQTTTECEGGSEYSNLPTDLAKNARNERYMSYAEINAVRKIARRG